MPHHQIRKAGGVLVIAALLTSCITEEQPPIIVQAAPTATPQQLCQVTALAEERSSAIETVRGANMTGRETGQTFLRDKLKNYEASLEAAYRSMVSSCQLYANCLDRNSSDETRCLRSENNYSAARGQFYDMVRQGQTLAAEARRVRTSGTQTPSQKSTENREGRCKPECATTANIFTDDCCPAK